MSAFWSVVDMWRHSCALLSAFVMISCLSVTMVFNSRFETFFLTFIQTFDLAGQHFTLNSKLCQMAPCPIEVRGEYCKKEIIRWHRHGLDISEVKQTLWGARSSDSWPRSPRPRNLVIPADHRQRYI